MPTCTFFLDNGLFLLVLGIPGLPCYTKYIYMFCDTFLMNNVPSKYLESAIDSSFILRFTNCSSILKNASLKENIAIAKRLIYENPTTLVYYFKNTILCLNTKLRSKLTKMY